MDNRPTTENQESLGTDFSKIRQTLREKWWITAIISVLAVLGTGLGHLSGIAQYTAVSSVEIKSNNGPSLSQALSLSPFASFVTDAGKLVNHIRSMNFLLSVAETVKFADTSQIMLVHSGHNFGKCTKYRFDQTSSFSSMNIKNVLSGSSLRKRSLPRVEAIMVPLDRLACFLDQVTEVSSAGDLIVFKVTTPDAYTSMKLTNALARTFTHYLNHREIESILEIEKLLTAKLSEAEKELAESEANFIEFQKKNQEMLSHGTDHPLAVQLQRTNSLIQDLKLKIEENQALLQYYEHELQKMTEKVIAQGAEIAEPSASGQISALQDKIDKVMADIELMRYHGFAEDDWRVTEAKMQITKWSEELRLIRTQNPIPLSPDNVGFSPKELRQKISSLHDLNKSMSSRLDVLLKARTAQLEKVKDLPGTQSESVHLKSQVNWARERYNNLVKKLNEIELQKVSQKNRAMVNALSDLPIPKGQVSLPLKLIFALLAGLFFGSLTSLLIQYLDPSIKDMESLRRLGFTVLGSVTAIRESKAFLRASGPTLSGKIEHLVEVEQICSLLETTVRKSESARVFLVTSSKPGEGKSFTASSLARCFSSMGKRTLLADCDLRRSMIHLSWNLPNDKGLSDLIDNGASFEQAMTAGVLPKLDVLTAGTHNANPSFLLNNAKLSILFKHLRQTYDVIIIDSPPINLMADATLLARFCDQIIVVAAYGLATNKDLKEIRDRIHKLKMAPPFSILNQTPRNHKHDQYRYYYREIKSKLPPDCPDQNELREFEAQFLRNATVRKAS